MLEKLKVPKRLLALRHEHEGDTVLNARDMQGILELYSHHYSECTVTYSSNVLDRA
ncbi:MAG: hypothetical protein GY801_16920 [bacterium]|nr:hypothetical protein [bacterium]